MNTHNPARFYLENLQFSWMPTQTSHYRWLRLRICIVYGLVVGLVVGLVFGLVRVHLTEEQLLIPNQRIIASRTTARRIIQVGLIGTLIVGVLLGVLFFTNLSVLQLLNQQLQFPHQDTVPLTDRLIVLTLLPISVALIGAFFYGGNAYLLHFTLRNQLARVGYTPRHLDAFLDYATAAILLRRTGGGYRFLHREYQDDFARQFMQAHDIPIPLDMSPDPVAITSKRISPGGSDHES